MMYELRQQYISKAWKWFVVAIITAIPAMGHLSAFCEYLKGAING